MRWTIFFESFRLNDPEFIFVSNKSWINLKNILKKAYPSAALILPSNTKSKVIEKIIPNEITDTIDLIKTKYH